MRPLSEIKKVFLFENVFSNGLVVFKLIFKLNKREVPTCHRKVSKIVMCV